MVTARESKLLGDLVILMLMILTRDQHNFESSVPSGDLGPSSKICTQGAVLSLSKINNKTLYPLTVPGLVRPGLCLGFLAWLFWFCFEVFFVRHRCQ